MLKKCLQKNGLILPSIGQGLGKYADESTQVDVIREGVDMGANFIDTAESYGNGQSEEIISKAICGMRDMVILGTKFGPKNSSEKRMNLSLENSLKRLRTDYIDLYQLHWVNPSIPFEETFLCLEKMVKSGKIRHIGICNVSLFEIKKISSLLSDNKISSVQIEYNLFDRSIEDNGILQYCDENNIIVIGYTPLDRGRVVDGDKNRKNILDISRKYGCTPHQIAMRILTLKRPVVIIPHTTSKIHVIENFNSQHIDISNEDMQFILDTSKKEIQYVDPKDICVIMNGEDNRNSYETIDEAIENKMNFSPSPVQLCEYLKENDYIKPVRLVKSRSKKNTFDLVEGRIRYWAWVLAFSDRKIPSLIRENWPT